MGVEAEAISNTRVISVENKMVSQGLPDNSSVLSTEFPIGLRVLVVDDDPICLLILDRMLQRCRYKGKP